RSSQATFRRRNSARSAGSNVTICKPSSNAATTSAGWPALAPLDASLSSTFIAGSLRAAAGGATLLSYWPAVQSRSSRCEDVRVSRKLPFARQLDNGYGAFRRALRHQHTPIQGAQQGEVDGQRRCKSDMTIHDCDLHVRARSTLRVGH